MTETAKISSVLLQFAKPIFRSVGEDLQKAEMEQCLQLAVIVWNAVVLEQTGISANALEQARDLVHQQALPEAVRVFDALIEHKHQAFAEDQRIILDFRVIESPDGRLGVSVDAGQANELGPGQKK